MSAFVPPCASLSEAWALALAQTQEAGGHLVHLTMTVTEPGLEDPEIRSTVDEFLGRPWPKKCNAQSIETVAGTIFPIDLYPSPRTAWTPDLSPPDQETVDSSRAFLYEAYLSILPTLKTVASNSRGTYFSRMISWPGADAGGPNQLETRIFALRKLWDGKARTNNLQDIDLSADSMPVHAGLQLTKADESRIYGFPCLVHLSLTLVGGRLNLLGVYRHQYMVTKAYGNLLGLSRLLHFLAEQTGFEVGELCVQATYSDDERGAFHADVDSLVAAVARRGGCGLMGLAVGIDLVDINQTAVMLEGEAGLSFRETCWTPAERIECGARVDRLSTRWAAKEATMKALGLGIGDLDLLSVEIVTTEGGRPELVLHGEAAERASALGLAEWSVSMSHEGPFAVAMVIGKGAGS